MKRAVIAAILWFFVFWTLGSWADAYLGIHESVGFVIGLLVAGAILMRASRRQRQQAAAAAQPAAGSVEVGPVVPA